jgi:hypothetical protein
MGKKGSEILDRMGLNKGNAVLIHVPNQMMAFAKIHATA